MDAWLGSPALILLHENESYWFTLKQLVAASNVAGGRVHDARIAALCMSHSVTELWTMDRDFGLFPQLNARNPFAPPAS